MNITITSSTLPEFTRVIEFNLDGRNYWSEYTLTDSGFDWIINTAEGKRLTREDQIALFKTDDEGLIEAMDNLIEKAEDYEVDRVIEWRKRVSK